MTLLQLQYFQALAHTLHYTRTAEDLHISQPSLSYAIRELEEELGVELFRTERRQTVLTASGQHFLPYVEHALSLIQEGVGTVRQRAGNARQDVRLGYFHSVAASFIPTLVDGFYRQAGNMSIRFQFLESPSYEILSQVQSGALDLGFTLHQAGGVQAVQILRQRLYLAIPASHPLASRRLVSFIDFAGEPQIMLEHGSNLRESVDALFSAYRIIPNVAFEVRECNAALQYVGLAYGVAILPHVPAMNSEKVAILPIEGEDKELDRPVYLVSNNSSMNSVAVQQVRDYIIQNYTKDV